MIPNGVKLLENVNENKEDPPLHNLHHLAYEE